jgi:hypothetical protein
MHCGRRWGPEAYCGFGAETSLQPTFAKPSRKRRNLLIANAKGRPMIDFLISCWPLVVINILLVMMKLYDDGFRMP